MNFVKDISAAIPDFLLSKLFLIPEMVSVIYVKISKSLILSS